MSLIYVGLDSFPKKTCPRFIAHPICLYSAPAMLPKNVLLKGLVWFFLRHNPAESPVVGTRSGGIPAAIHDGKGGWLIEEDDGQKLTGIIRELVRSPESFRTAGTEARERVLRENTWERYGQRFVSTLQSAGIFNG